MALKRTPIIGILTVIPTILAIVGSCVLLPTSVVAQLSEIAAVSLGGGHTCALTTAGGVKCWGRNTSGQLGDSSTISRSTAIDPTNLSSGLQAIALGYNTSCTLNTAGGVKCWGRNNYGQLGDGSTTNSSTAVDSIGLTIGIQTISLGYEHSCALTTAGGAKCWGKNDYGQLGDGSTTSRYTAVNSTGLTGGLQAIALGDSHTCALTTAGGVKCWGRNNYGQLGDGSTTNRSTAVDSSGLSSGIQSIALGSSHSCVLTTSGGSKCWGLNSRGQLGDGSTTNRSTAVNSSGLTSGLQALALGNSHTCALSTAGGAKCWGNNDRGQLGDSSTTERHTAVDSSGMYSSLQSISLGYYHSCALTTAGGVKCWGDQSSDQLGDGSTNYRSSAVDSTGLSMGMLAISLGNYHTCALGTSGGVKCWGDNWFGQLGDGSTISRSTAADLSTLSSGVQTISLGAIHTCAISTAGGVKCWGRNNYGQLGDGSTTDRLTPVNASGLSNGVQAISIGDYHTCALTTAGGAKCWGYNTYGQLGDSSTTSRSTAVNSTGLTSGLQAISLGDDHTCALTTAGGVKCWGRNNYGQLGDDSTTNRSTAVDATGLTSGMQAISLGNYHSCALTTAGGVKCWGYNNNAQLGDGSTTNRYTAVDAIGLTSGIQAISPGYYHTCGLTTAGGAKCWGSNIFGYLGDGSTLTRTTAVDAVGLTSGMQAISLGAEHTCALTTAGGVKCWGASANGALGEAPFIHTVLRGMTAQGQVTLSGSPLSGVILRATGMGAAYINQESTTDGSGGYTLPIVETVPFTITPELAGYTFSPPSLSATMAAALTQDFVATLITHNITGTVTGNSNPLSGATIDGGPLGSQITNGSGAYDFSGVTPGTVYTLAVSHPGATFGLDTATGTLNSDVTHNFSGTLTTHTLSGTITVGGSPLAGVTVSGGVLGDTTTDGSGAYSFAGVTYGTNYTITPTLTDYDLTPTSSSGTVTDNATHDFIAVYNLITTTTSSLVPTTTVAITTTEPTTIASTSISTTTTVEPSSTIEATSTIGASSTIDFTTTIESTTVPTSTTVIETSTPTPTTTTPADSDGDGIPDSKEQALGTDPENADSDNDGVTDSEELTAGTNPNDPGSKATKLRSRLCADWNGYLGGTGGRGMYNIMEHINLTTKKIRVKTELRNIGGHLKDTYEFFLRGNQQFDLLVHDMGGREVNSYGQVCSTYERAPAGSVDGRMVYYKYGDAGDMQFAFALPFEDPLRGATGLLFNTKQPSLDPQDSSNLVANWVQLSNVSKKRLKGTLTFYSLGGTALGSYSVDLRDGARYDYPGHAWGSQAGLARFVPENSTVDYQLRAVRYLYDNADGRDSFTTAYPFGAAVGSGETLIAPVDTSSTSSAADLTDLQSNSAILELSNTLNKKVAVALNLYDNTGKKLLYSKTHSFKAYSALHLPLDTLLLNSTGLLTAKSSHSGSIIGSVVHYGRVANGGLINLYAVPLREPVGTVFKGSYNTYLNQGCTLYLGNSSTSKEKVTVALRQNDGTSPVNSYSLTVPSQGLLVDNVCAKSQNDTYGVLIVTATKSKRITGLLLRVGERGRYKIATEMR